MNRRVLITGCSGGGKSTLLRELSDRGFAVVEEPGRRVVESELSSGGNALPWTDMAAFARRALALARADIEAMCCQTGTVFFDRGILDAAVALHHAAGVSLEMSVGASFPYDRTVFVAPPWAEIFRGDAAQRHGWCEAVNEYDRLVAAIAGLGCEILELPKTDVRERADFVIAALA